MKEIALQLAARSGDQRLNVLREYVQNEILFILQTGGFSERLFFVGGTALKFLYGTRRFSEHLDFSAGRTWRKQSLGAMAARLSNELTKSGYEVELPFKGEKTVARASVRFGRILMEAGLSHRRGQVFSVNILHRTISPFFTGDSLPCQLTHYSIGAILLPRWITGLK